MNEDTTYKGIWTIIENFSELDENGYWNVTHSLIQKRSKDLVNWEEKTVKIVAFSNDLAKAVADASLSMAAYLHKINFNLFDDGQENKQVYETDD